MPFGCESTWDNMKYRKDIQLADVTNAFRQQVHLGHMDTQDKAYKLASPMPFGNESTWDILAQVQAGTQAFESPMPFGNKSTWDWMWRLPTHRGIRVTNAFRQRVHLGPDGSA